MKRIILVLLVTVCFGIPSLSFGQPKATANILSRLFCIKNGNQTAAGFVIEVDNRQYMITAKHLFPNLPAKGSIEILQEEKWIPSSFTPISAEPDSVDIVALALDKQLSPLLPVGLGSKGMILSDFVFFLGFPYGLFDDGGYLNNGYPIPMVKHGIISGFGQKNEPFLVDGINNPGFSGGPIITVDPYNQATIIGVVSGYKAAQETVFQGEKRSNYSINTNTGLLLGYRIDHVLSAIKKKPIGFKVEVVVPAAKDQQ